jgi:hypothetical protein
MMPSATLYNERVTFAELERRALEAHAHGERWGSFWRSVQAEVIRMAGYSRPSFRRLVERLLSLVVAGDMDGVEPPGSAASPWDIEDCEAGQPAPYPLSRVLPADPKALHPAEQSKTRNTFLKDTRTRPA